MPSIRWSFLAFLGVLLSQPTKSEAAYQAVAHLTLQGQQGNPILNNSSVDITYNNLAYGSNSASILGPLENGAPAFLSFNLQQLGVTADTISELAFSTVQLGVALTPGTYTNAQRALFATAGHSGLDVGYGGAGSNTLTGSFTVNYVSFFNDPSVAYPVMIATFSASFIQYSDGNPNPLRGTFTYQNFSPLATAPEPASLAMLGIGIVGLLGFGRGCRRSGR